MNTSVCCFSGYRPEKMPRNMAEGSPDFLDMQARLCAAIQKAADAGYVYFLSGMSRGFDLWAAEAVLSLRQRGCDLRLWASIAFPGMDANWEPEWRRRYADVLSRSDRIFPVAQKYEPDCYAMRDRFLVQQSSRCICFYDGVPGGTAYTVKLARRCGLTIDNLADMQLTFDSLL